MNVHLRVLLVHPAVPKKVPHCPIGQPTVRSAAVEKLPGVRLAIVMLAVFGENARGSSPARQPKRLPGPIPTAPASMSGMIGDAVIGSWTYELIRDTGDILLDMNPDRPVANRLRQAVDSVGGRLADLPLWHLAPGLPISDRFHISPSKFRTDLDFDIRARASSTSHQASRHYQFRQTIIDTLQTRLTA
jgi:hypothetical protein